MMNNTFVHSLLLPCENGMILFFQTLVENSNVAMLDFSILIVRGMYA